MRGVFAFVGLGTRDIEPAVGLVWFPVEKGLATVGPERSVTGVLVPWTKIFAGKYGPPLEKLVQVEDAHSMPSFSNNRI